MAAEPTPDRDDPAREKLGREAPVETKAPLDALELAQAAAYLCGEKKAENVVLLDVEGICGYADYFVIASGLSERQTIAIAKSVDDSFRKGGAKPYGTEGLKQGSWALLDYGDMVVHVFLDSARDYYDLEGFWSDGKAVEASEEAGIEALRKMGLNKSGEPLPQQQQD